MKYNKHHKNVSAFVISIRNHVIDFARKCINILRWLPMCAHQLALDAWLLINFDTLDSRVACCFISKKLDYFSVSFILIIITMNDWRPQILRREEKSPFLCWKKERQRAREREKRQINNYEQLILRDRDMRCSFFLCSQ